MGNAGIAGRQHIRAQHPMGGAQFNRLPMGMRHPGQMIHQQQPVSLLPEGKYQEVIKNVSSSTSPNFFVSEQTQPFP